MWPPAATSTAARLPLPANDRRHHLGLRHRRRWHGRVRLGEPTVGGSAALGAPAGGGPARYVPVDSYSDRVRQDDVPPGLQLDVQDRARPRYERARDLLAVRSHAGWIEFDQRAHLH